MANIFYFLGGKNMYFFATCFENVFRFLCKMFWWKKKRFFYKMLCKSSFPHHLEWFTHILGQIPFYRPSLSSSLTILSNLDLFPKIYQGGKGLVLIPYLDDLSTLEGYFGYFHITESTLLLGLKIPFLCFYIYEFFFKLIWLRTGMQ